MRARSPVWIPIICSACLVLESCEPIKHTESREQRAKHEFDEFCVANGAKTAFRGLPERDVLTLDLQRSLFLNQSRVAFTAQLVDLWKSKKRATMIAGFKVQRGAVDVDVYLKCTEAQAEQLHDAYQKNKDAMLFIAADFEETDRLDSTNSDADPDSDSRAPYSALGTLAAWQVAKETAPNKGSSGDGNE